MADKNKVIGRAGRVQREQQQNKIITYLSVAVVSLVVILILTGIIMESYVYPRLTVATVNGEKISVKEYEDRTRILRYSWVSQYQQYADLVFQFQENPEFIVQLGLDSRIASIDYQLLPEVAARSSLTALIDDYLVRQEADKLGISVSAEEINREIEEAYFGYFADGQPAPVETATTLPTSTLSPTQLELVTSTPTLEPSATAGAEGDATEGADVVEATATEADLASPTATVEIPTATIQPTEEFGTVYTEQMAIVLETIGVDEATFRAFYESNLIREKMVDYVTSDLNAKREMVWARHILVEDEALALQLIDELRAGAAFPELAMANSIDPSAVSNLGDLGWFDSDTMVPEFSDAAFSLEVGEISEPVASSFGFHIIQVLGHEDRPLTAEQFTSYRNQVFFDWIDEVRVSAEIEEKDIWMDRIVTSPEVPLEISQGVNYLLQQLQLAAP